MATTIPSYCAQCRSRCGVIATVEGGRLLSIDADPSHPSGHKICPKGRAAAELVHSHERLLWPMKRTRPKGAADPGWVRISWEEALSLVAGGLRAVEAEQGARAVAFAIATPSGTAISDAIDWIERLANAYGAPNIIYATEICNWHKDELPKLTFGGGIGIPDFANSPCIVLWGHNPLVSWLAHAGEVQKGLRKGAKLIVVDPRPAGFARRADAWLRVRPGTDGALALGLAHLVIESGRYDRAFLERWSNGPLLVREDTGRFLRAGDLGLAGEPALLLAARGAELLRYDPRSGAWLDDPAGLDLEARLEVPGPQGALACRSAFARYADLCREYPPERVERLTDVPAAEVRRAADLLAAAGRFAHYAWTGVGQHVNASQTSRALSLLQALLGSYDAPGGNLQQPGVPLADVAGWELRTPGQRAMTLGRERLPLGPWQNSWVMARDVYRAIRDGEPYPVRALLGFGANLLLSQPDGGEASAALAALAFHVQLDSVLTPTAAFADVVLPVATGWEREGLRGGFGCSAEAQFHLQLKPAAIAPLGEARPDIDIVFDLASRLGLGDRFFGGDVDAGLRHRLAPSGATLEELRARPEGLRLPGAPGAHRYREAGFGTATRLAEIWSEPLLAAGQAPLPDYRPPAATDSAFDLVLNTAKTVAFCHSQHRHAPSLRRLMPDPTVELAPAAAAARGLAAGDWLSIETARGSFRARAKLTPDQHPSTVTAQHGWWQGCEELGAPAYPATGEGTANANAAIPTDIEDPISGSIPLRSTPCRVRKLPA